MSYITSLQAFFDFAVGCDVPVHIVRRAIEDNDPSDGEVSLENCVAQALAIWWLSSNNQQFGSQIKLDKDLSSCTCQEFIPV